MPSEEESWEILQLLFRLVLHRALLGPWHVCGKQKVESVSSLTALVLGSHVWAATLAQLEFLMYDCYGFETGSGLAMSPSLALNSLEMMV